MWFRSESKLKKIYFEKNGGLILDQLSNNNKAAKIIKFSSNELKSATDNYSNILGGGADGTVFKGTMKDGAEVAVKRSEIEARAPDDVKSFVNEIVMLSQVDHRNIVRLLGCCLETEVPHLVYEFVPGGDLARRLRERGGRDGITLTWAVRLRIAVEVAGALAYMHAPGSLHFFHRDVKSANILLDQRHKAKLADFGISRSVTLNQTHVTTKSSGTGGYLDPEFAQSGGHYTAKSDVYSFGVVLVELITGRVATDMINVQDGSVRSLSTHFVKSVEGNRLWGIVDTRVKAEGDRSAIEAVAALAKWCLNSSGRQRPTMKQVGDELDRIRMLPSGSD